MKTFLYSCLFFVAVMSMNSCSSEEIEVNDPTSITMKNNPNLQAYEAGTKILKSFNSSVTRSISDEQSYPSYYGGMYIDKSGELHVLIKGDVDAYKNTMARTAGSDNIIMHPCTYAYSELLDMLKHIHDYNVASPNSSAAVNFKIAKLDDVNNNIVVELNDCSGSEIAKFKSQVSDSPAIVFEQTQSKAIEHSLNAGEAVYVKRGSDFYAATMGYRAKVNNVIGWVTAAHAYSQGQYVYNTYGQNIGTCQKSVYQGSIDAAFCVSTDAGYSPTNTLRSGAALSTSTTSIIAGMAVTMYGGQTGSNIGSITNSSTSIKTESNVQLYDVALASYYSLPGDSGSPIVYVQNGQNYVVGIHHGNYGGSTVVIKESNIRSSLGAVRY